MIKRAQPYHRDTALKIAQALFWRKGYHATSIKDLESALTMKPGSIYAAFKSKETLFLLTLERYYTEGRKELEDLIDAAPSPLQGLADHLRIYGQGATDCDQNSACMLIKTLLEVTEDDATISARARQYLDEMLTVFIEMFEAAKSNGELKASADTAMLARKYQSQITALRIEAHRGTDPVQIQALADGFALEFEQLKACA